MESLNGRTKHVYVIYMHLSMLTGQTGLPPNQPNGLKVKNLHNFDIFQLNWLKLGMESLNGRIQHMHTIYPVKPACLPPNQPTSLKVNNVHNFAIFQRICMKLCMDALKG